MHMYVHCDTVYNSKDLCPSMIDWIRKCGTYTPWNTMQPQKTMSSCPLKDMDESEEHHSQQTDTITENEIPHVLTHRWVMNNENTWTRGGNITHWDLSGSGRLRKG